jgi:S-adenosylmethionine-dependent methyltransferase
MKETTVNDAVERFQDGAAKYAAYLNTPEGRLRLDLAFANLQESLPESTGSLHALDLGCGTGAIGVRLARLGFQVTLLDCSQQMLDLARKAASEAGVMGEIELKYGDAAQLANLMQGQSFDVIVCHNLMEYVDDPFAVLRSTARALRNSSAILSVLVRNQAGEVLKSAIQSGDLAAAEAGITAGWGQESLYGGRVRLFKADALKTMLKAASLAPIAERGVRVISDYLPPQVSRSEEYQRILELERKLGSRPEFAAVARYTHCLARRAGSAVEDRA